MKLENLWLLSWQNVRRNRRRLLLSSLGVVFGIATLIFFFSLTSGVRNLIFEKFLRRLPANQIRLNPEYKSDLLGWAINPGNRLKAEDNKESKDEDRIAPEKVDKVRAIEGVNQIYGLTQIETDCVLYALKLDSTANTKIGISSYPTEYFAEDIPEGKDWKFNPSRPIPLLINPQMLVAWNEIFSGSYNYPKADVETISEIPLFLTVRNNSTGDRDIFDARVIGLSSKAPLFAPLVPIDFVEVMNEASFGEGFSAPFSSMIVELENPTYVEEVLKQTKALGFEAGGEQRVAEMIDMAINVLTLFLTAISLIIVFISLINVFNIFLINVMERRFEIGVMRAVGAGKGNIRWMILLEAGVVGIANGIIGAILGFIAIGLVESFVGGLIVTYAGEGSSLFALSPLLILAIIFASPIVNMLAVLQPANYAARLDPVRALRK